jgi:quinol monooxygenase YgiN
MILLIIRMKVVSEKRMELTQTIASLSGSIRMEKGCRRCEICQSIEDENRLFLLEEWDTRENLTAHLKSKHFMVLRGSMNLLKEPYEWEFSTVSHPVGIDEILGENSRQSSGKGRSGQEGFREVVKEQ